MPGTPDQLSFAVIRPVFVQSWLNGSVCGALVAATGRAGMIDSRKMAMRATAAGRRRS